MPKTKDEIDKAMLEIFQTGVKYGHAQAMKGATLEMALKNGSERWELSAIAATKELPNIRHWD